MDDMRKENRELRLMPYNQAIAFTRLTYGIGGKVDSAHVMRREVVNKPTLDRKPNVVVILMESMSASLMREFGQQLPLTPTLDSLYQHSLAFTNFYSAGIHTNHGMTATLYSFPAVMFRNLMKGTVTPHRQGLPTVLKGLGYDNMFFMSHEAQYDNMKAFFTTNGYDEIFSQESYPKDSVVNSFGVSDHFEFDFALQQINKKAKSRRPFMATILTISNHPPYVVPDWFKPRTKEAETLNRMLIDGQKQGRGAALSESTEGSAQPDQGGNAAQGQSTPGMTALSRIAVYVKNPKGIKNLGFTAQMYMTEELLAKLKERFGDGNVVFVPGKIRRRNAHEI